MKTDDIVVSNFELQNHHGAVIRGNVHYPATIIKSPVLLFVHGFKGFKDWGGFSYIADRFAAEGWTVVRFNFSLNGIGEDDMNFTELDNFRQNTFSRELDDLGDVIDAVENRTLFDREMENTGIALMGHSRGGGIVIIKAAEDRRVGALVSLSAVSSFDRWGAEVKRKWRERGFLEILNTRTGQRMPLGAALLDDAEQNADRLNITGCVAKLRIPFLIVHGEQDVSVPVDEARELYTHADKSLSRLEIIPNTEHTFGVVHPYQGPTEALEEMLRRTASWLENKLSG